MKNYLKWFLENKFTCLALICFSLALQTSQISAEVHYIQFNDVFNTELSSDAIIRNEKGFENDFLVIHCLIRQYRPSNLFEIGTCEGAGTMIIKNAIGSGTVYSLELPPGESAYALSKESIGSRCSLPFVQLFGNSMSYDYSRNFPIESWFIDGWHDYEHVYYETTQALFSNPLLIMWHDTDIPEIFKAVLDVLEESSQYDVYRVVDTRMTYAVRK
jgi:predicted O-methyltransferase YrrM